MLRHHELSLLARLGVEVAPSRGSPLGRNE